MEKIKVVQLYENLNMYRVFFNLNNESYYTHCFLEDNTIEYDRFYLHEKTKEQFELSDEQIKRLSDVVFLEKEFRLRKIVNPFKIKNGQGFVV